MKISKVLRSVLFAIAAAGSLWAIGTTLSLPGLEFSVSPGDTVSASQFNDVFQRIDSNFTLLKDSLPGGAQALSELPTNLGVGTATVAQVDVVAPFDGYIYASASGSIYFTQDADEYTEALYSLALEPNTLPFEMQFRVMAPMAVGDYAIPFSIQHMFPVVAGANTIYLNAAGFSGPVQMGLVSLSAFYLPASYGSVVVTNLSEASE